MIDVINLQKSVRIETAAFRAFVKTLNATLSEIAGHTFTVAFITDDRMQQLNEMFRGKDSTTDVLSFPHEPEPFELVSQGFPPNKGGVDAASADGVGLSNEQGRFLGDIVISAEQAQKQADENGLTVENEIKQLILHGLLHLCGHDHETDKGEMNKRELELREQLGI